VSPRLTLAGILGLTTLSACASPSYVDKSKESPGLLGINEVIFEVRPAYRSQPPDCVAILPLRVKAGSAVRDGDAAKVRRSLYAHLSTQSKRSVRLERIDHVWAETNHDLRMLGSRLHCAAVIEGEVSAYDASFYGIYSRVAVAVDLRMIRTDDEVVLWEVSHSATSHGGALPLDPVGLALGVADAASNIRDEQLLRVTDDLARRLVATIPDNPVRPMEDPADDLATLSTPPQEAPVSTGGWSDQLRCAEAYLAQGDHDSALACAERAIAIAPNRPQAWFLKGRVLMLEQNFAKAEPAIVKAVALDSDNATYLNALGAVSAGKGDTERALAAYRMAINADPGDGFAWYNSGVIAFNSGRPDQAAQRFYLAGLAYLKSGAYAKAERALADLKEMSKSGIPLQPKIRTIEDALAEPNRRKT